MKTKTCGECKYFFVDSEGYCISNDGSENAHNDACSFFEPKIVTNGDHIRQMSNEELAKHWKQPLCYCCIHGKRVDNGEGAWCNAPSGTDCSNGFLAWLNAPAESKESEVEDE